MKKRIGALSLASVLLVNTAYVAFPAYAATDNGLSASVTKAAPGDEITLTVAIPKSDKKADSVGYWVNYDSSVFEFVSADYDFGNSSLIFDNTDPAKGYFAVAGSMLSVDLTNGNTSTVKLKVKNTAANGTHSVTLTKCSASYYDATSDETVDLWSPEVTEVSIVVKAPAATHTVTTPDEVTLTAEDGSTVASGSAVEEGTKLKLGVAVPDGKQIKSLTVNGTSYNNGDTFEVGTSNVEVKVEFETKTYKVTIGDGVTVKNGDKAVASGDEIAMGTKLTVTAEVPEGKRLDRLMVANVAVDDGSEFTLNADTEITAELVGSDEPIVSKEISTVNFTIADPAIGEELASVISDFVATAVTTSTGDSYQTTSGVGATLTWTKDGEAASGKAGVGTYKASVKISLADWFYLAESLKAPDGWTLAGDTLTKEFKIEAKTQEAPAAPTMKSRTTTSITLDTIAANANGAEVEYSMDGTTWQDSPEFTGLTANTSYTFYARYKATDVYAASPASEGAKFSTKSSSGSSGGKSSGSSHRKRSSSSSSTSTSTTEPSISDGSASGWTAIAAKLNTSADGSTVTINLNGSTEVPADVIKAIADNKDNVKLVVSTVFSWTVDGTKISSATKGDFTVTKTTAGTTTGLRGIVGTAFSVNGTGVPAELNISFKASHANKFANLYLKNADGTFTFVDNVKIDSKGAANGLDADSKGNYVVMLSEYSDRLGDADNNGAVNALDASDILKNIVGLEDIKNEAVADYDKNGSVNALDASAILKMIVGLK